MFSSLLKCDCEDEGDDLKPIKSKNSAVQLSSSASGEETSIVGAKKETLKDGSNTVVPKVSPVVALEEQNKLDEDEEMKDGSGDSDSAPEIDDIDSSEWKEKKTLEDMKDDDVGKKESDDDLPPDDDDMELSSSYKRFNTKKGPPTKKMKRELKRKSGHVYKKGKFPPEGERDRYLKIVVVSDTHKNDKMSKVPEDCDIFIFCGDFSHFRDWKKDTAGLIIIPPSVAQFNKSLNQIKTKFRFVICGNHDYLNYFSKKDIQEKILPNCMYLQDDSFVLDMEKSFPEKKYSKENQKIKIFGSPWTIQAMAFGSRNLKPKWDLIEKDTNILVTHTPPHFIMDLACTPGQISKEKCKGCGVKHVSYTHWGCKHLLDKVKYLHTKKELKLHCFGHVHDVRGIQYERYQEKKEMVFINASNPRMGFRPPQVYYYPLT